MLESFFNWRRAVFASGFALVVLASPATLFANQKADTAAGQKSGVEQKQPQTTAATTAQAKEKPWSVKMTRSAPQTFTIKAKDASMSEIAGELSRLLKVPVTLSPVMSKQRVTLDFGGLNLEATLRMLAPQPYIDYVAGGDEAQPKPLAIYLQANNERAPSTTAAVHGNTEAILIEGDTEEGTDSEAQKKKEEEDPLRVTFANNQLSVRARKQPLSVVLFKIANEVGVPFELRYESPETVDIEFTNYPLEQAFRSLSPGVRFYYRLDLQTFQVQPLRLALLSPASAKS
ncbi:MAG: hypothetical protein QOC99_2899 [Acidobacteriota bacterium]|jgi:hypothetical protein|nr:hypothetical protein [Acidobacteriota bacterium]MDT7780387.1 hypothetical protein [Acidobacteriota bacterium]